VRSTLGTDRERGTGLGLRLCKDFVEMNGGKLSFTSELNSGSVFRFTLPAVAKEAHLPIVSVQDEAEDASVAAG
jgi:signal transduction histidine kinase